MATFQTMTGVKLPLQLTLFVGNVLKIKIVPGRGELVPFKLSISPNKSLLLTADDVRTKANFEIYELKANGPGFVRFEAQNAKGTKAGPISVTIKPLLTLPTGNADQLALIKLLLAESPSPYSANYNATTAKTGLQWMRLVVKNRLDMKSGRVGSQGATSMIDVIKSPGQFKGFEEYPTIGTKQQGNITDILTIANDGTHPKQKLFADHIAAAIAAATEQAIVDPCATKLLSWRTEGASSPGGDFKLYKIFSGQDFYTIPAADKK
ncbi:MAG: hypothetical protein V4660_10190 [Pseudomonadota bacterium]